MALCKRLILFRSYLFLLMLFGGAVVWQLSFINNTVLLEEYVPKQTANDRKVQSIELSNNSPLRSKLESHHLEKMTNLHPVPVPVQHLQTNKSGVNQEMDEASKRRSRDLNVDSWKEVTPSTDGRILVFSAYFDDRVGEPLVRVMGAALTKRRKAVFCGVFAKNGKFIFHGQAKLRKLPENWNLPYTAVQFYCSLPKKSNEVPGWVVIAEKFGAAKNGSSSSRLPVHFHGSRQRNGGKDDTNEFSPHHRKGFAVCVKPLHYNYDRAVWMVEFFEMHRLLGVEQFFIYNHTVGPNVQKVLKFYEDSHLVTVLPWELDLKSQKEIRTEGIFVSLNDCLYRTMHRYNYTVMIDFDEYIVPTQAKQTYSQMIAGLQNKNAGSFIFQNYFFYLYWDNDTTILEQFRPYLSNPSKSVNRTNAVTTNIRMADVPYLITLFKTQRVKVPNKHLVRSKYIVRPEMAVVVGNHNIPEHVRGFSRVLVPHTVASSHHYRICEFGGYDCLKKAHEFDRTTWSYAGQLIPRVFDVCKQAFPETGQCPTAPPLGPAF